MAQSGAGAELTKIAESAQCVFAAARFYVSNKDLEPTMVTETMLSKAMSHVDVDDRHVISNIFKKLDADWHISLCLTANRLHDMFGASKGAKEYIFQRGSKFVDGFEKQYKHWNDDSGKFFSNINKYTPADIWITSKKFKNFRWDTMTMCDGGGCFGESNKFLLEEYNNKDIIGVSLKKTSTAIASYYNMPGMSKYKFKYTGYTLSSGNFFNSKDVYINYDMGRIQFRSFSSRATSWQGEIKGQEANLGKIGGGVITKVVHATFPRKDKDIFAITESNVISEEVKKPTDLSEDFIKDFHYYYRGLQSGKKATLNEMAIELRKKQSTWIYSKYLGMELLTLFEDLTRTEADKLITNVLLYAMSASPDSAPFVKIG